MYEDFCWTCYNGKSIDQAPIIFDIDIEDLVL